MLRSRLLIHIYQIIIRTINGPYPGTHFTNDFFHHNSNSMENSFSSNSITVDHIATKFYTCHDSQAVVPCAKFCSDHFINTWMRAKWNFHHIWIVMAKLLVKWAQEANVWFTVRSCVTVSIYKLSSMGITVIVASISKHNSYIKNCKCVTLRVN